MDAQDRANGDTFEDLWLLRTCYPFRSDYDTRGTLTVEAAVTYGEGLMRLVHLREHWGRSQRLRPPEPSGQA